MTAERGTPQKTHFPSSRVIWPHSDNAAFSGVTKALVCAQCTQNAEVRLAVVTVRQTVGIILQAGETLRAASSVRAYP